MVIFKSLLHSAFLRSNILNLVNKNKTKAAITINKHAYAIYPIPNAKPAAVEIKIIQISFAVPGADLNLTKLKAPATAIPAPILPFTSMITSATHAGIKAVVIKKLLDELDL